MALGKIPGGGGRELRLKVGQQDGCSVSALEAGLVKVSALNHVNPLPVPSALLHSAADRGEHVLCS